MSDLNLHSAKTKITKKLGYFPAFLIPAIKSSSVFCSLVKQTFVAYKNNPLPDLFKEKLFVYLSRYCGAEYFTICHSCGLRSLGAKPSEIIALGYIEYPQGATDIQSDIKFLEHLRSQSQDKNWQSQKQDQERVEASLLRCSSLIFFQPSQADICAETLKKFLGLVNYNYLIVFLGYVKLCHQWTKDNPDISHEQDQRSQIHLGSLLLSQIELAHFFRPHNIQLSIDQSINFFQDTVRLKDYQEPSLGIKSKLVNGDDKSLSDLSNNSNLKPEALVAFTTYLENLPFPVMICHESGQILYFNRSWLDTTGYSASEISTISQWKEKAKVKTKQRTIGKLSSSTALQTDLVNLPPVKRYANQIQDIAAETQDILQQIVDSLVDLVSELAQVKNQHQIENTIEREIGITTRWGEQRFWQLHSATLNYGAQDHQDELTISMVKDITDVHQVNSKLELVSEATQTGTWHWNLTNNQIDICGRGRAVLGLKNFDGSYGGFLQSIHPQERESVDLFLIKAVKAHSDINIECRIIHPDQRICWIKIRGRLNYSFLGKGTRIEGVVTDITPQKTAQKLAKKTAQNLGDPAQQEQTWQSFKQLENLINLLPCYLFVVDVPTKTISLMNSNLTKVLGLPNFEVVKGKKVGFCFSAAYTRQILWQQQQVLTYGEVLRIQEEVMLPDGSHHFHTVITPIRNDSGEISGILHTFSDIPNLIATQEALSQRSLQLEAANRELESFSYSVSHDLQAPLRIINGFSQVLWESCQPNLDDRAKHYLERIQANSQKMGDLIDALLELSRVTRSQMKSVNVNLSEIASEIVADLKAEYPQRQVEVKIAPDLHVQGDSQLLRIVLSNLLHNSWKYTSKRSLAKIEFNILGIDGKRLTYYIRDNGAGFDQDYADKLFKAFQRLHSQAEFPGTGIGLATVQRIIYRHGGKVWAEGESDRGATIYFSL